MKTILTCTTLITFFYLSNLSFSQDCTGELLCSKYESQKVELTMSPGTTQTVVVTFKNTGTSSWNNGYVALTYGDARANPQSNNVWSSDKIPMQQSTVAPGGNADFQFTISAPSKTGIYNFQWQVRSNGIPFGSVSPVVEIKVQ